MYTSAVLLFFFKLFWFVITIPLIGVGRRELFNMGEGGGGKASEGNFNTWYLGGGGGGYCQIYNRHACVHRHICARMHIQNKKYYLKKSVKCSFTHVWGQVSFGPVPVLAPELMVVKIIWSTV